MRRLADSAYTDAARVMNLASTVKERMMQAENVLLGTRADVDRTPFKRLQECLDDIFDQAAKIPLQVVEKL